MSAKSIGLSLEAFQPSTELKEKKYTIYQYANAEKQIVEDLFNEQTASLEKKVKDNQSQLYNKQAKWNIVIAVITGVLAATGWGLVAGIVAAIAIGLILGTGTIIYNLQDNSAWKGDEGYNYQLCSQERVDGLQRIDRETARAVLFAENQERVEKAIVKGNMWATLKDSYGNERCEFLGSATDYRYDSFLYGKAMWSWDDYATRSDGAVQAARQKIGKEIQKGSIKVTSKIASMFRDELMRAGYTIAEDYSIIAYGDPKKVVIN